jgi:hypothetical protein
VGAPAIREGRPHSHLRRSVIKSVAMLVNRSADAVECLQRATECEMQAERAADLIAKQSFLDLAARWRRVAETFKYIDRVDQSLQSKSATRNGSAI